MSAQCSSCQVQMGLDDGHDQCPSCLGVEHLRDALEDPCIHCNMIPLAVRRARLAGSSSNTGGMKRKAAASASATVPKQKKCKKELARRVDELADGTGKIQEFLSKLQPQPIPEVSESGSEETGMPPFSQPDYALFSDNIDCVSVAATDLLFSEEQSVSDKESGVIDSDDLADGQSEGSLVSDDLVDTIKNALTKLGIDPKSTAGVVHANRLCHSLPFPANVFTIPQSPDFTEVFSQAFKSAHSTRLDRVSRLLAAMEDPGTIGLGPMPPIEPAVASLIVPPDEALRYAGRGDAGGQIRHAEPKTLPTLADWETSVSQNSKVHLSEGNVRSAAVAKTLTQQGVSYAGGCYGSTACEKGNRYYRRQSARLGRCLATNGCEGNLGNNDPVPTHQLPRTELISRTN
ncbi:hypothetical protein G5714_010169 [Onychostoma macrolepis]|uniref:Uncharacterized protein n=1 Tax=Onychostoma macrolepis TaxID=369639 RepID=A0A7J6CPF9_9TELE|nr:hypothetical protein G5714_010169 [Onychostoma macrolepis]